MGLYLARIRNLFIVFSSESFKVGGLTLLVPIVPDMRIVLYLLKLKLVDNRREIMLVEAHKEMYTYMHACTCSKACYNII